VVLNFLLEGQHFTLGDLLRCFDELSEFNELLFIIGALADSLLHLGVSGRNVGDTVTAPLVYALAEFDLDSLSLFGQSLLQVLCLDLEDWVTHNIV